MKNVHEQLYNCIRNTLFLTKHIPKGSSSANETQVYVSAICHGQYNDVPTLYMGM